MLGRFFARCWGFVIPLLALPPIGFVLVIVGVNPDLVSILVMFATFSIMMATLVYIVVWDSKRRWPDVRTFDRLARVLTFYRESP